MSIFIASVAVPVGLFVGVCIVFWLIWQGIKAAGRKLLNMLLGPEDITP